MSDSKPEQRKGRWWPPVGTRVILSSCWNNNSVAGEIIPKALVESCHGVLRQSRYIMLIDCHESGLFGSPYAMTRLVSDKTDGWGQIRITSKGDGNVSLKAKEAAKSALYLRRSGKKIVMGDGQDAMENLTVSGSMFIKDDGDYITLGRYSDVVELAGKRWDGEVPGCFRYYDSSDECKACLLDKRCEDATTKRREDVSPIVMADCDTIEEPSLVSNGSKESVPSPVNGPVGASATDGLMDEVIDSIQSRDGTSRKADKLKRVVSVNPNLREEIATVAGELSAIAARLQRIIIRADVLDEVQAELCCAVPDDDDDWDDDDDAWDDDDADDMESEADFNISQLSGDYGIH